MALPIRPRTIPQCSACIRSYAFAETATSSSPAWRQQVRGKKSSAKTAGTMPVRLLKDYPGFGKKGSIIPLTRGEMRNKFFPRRIAEYVTVPELKILRANSVPIQRDYTYGLEQPVSYELAGPQETQTEALDAEEAAAALRAKQKQAEPEKLSPERSIQLLEIFVNPVLEFYRQPIVEEVKAEPEAAKPEPKKERQRTASSAAADLLAARSSAPLEKPKPKGPQAIYGSVSTHDVLVHVRAAIAVNDEAARVIVQESDIEFFDEAVKEEGKVKHVGDFTIEIAVKGAPTKVKRTVRVIPQEA